MGVAASWAFDHSTERVTDARRFLDEKRGGRLHKGKLKPIGMDN